MFSKVLLAFAIDLGMATMITIVMQALTWFSVCTEFVRSPGRREC